MSVKKSERMQVLRKLATQKERDAATAVSRQRSRVLAEEQQLQNLQEYYRDYLGAIDQQKYVGLNELVNYRSFCQQLAQAIGQGRKKLILLKKNMEAEKNTWFILHNKRRALDEMIDRYKNEERQHIEGQQEKEAADIWQSRHYRDQA